jgi:hypothetical protein
MTVIRVSALVVKLSKKSSHLLGLLSVVLQ